jgi:hypothetical protein
MKPAKLSREDVAVSHVAREHGIDPGDPSIAALRAAYRAGQRDGEPGAARVLRYSDHPNTTRPNG